MGRITSSLFAIITNLIFACPCFAGGSLGLDEVIQNLAGQDAKLMDEVSKLLSKEHLKISDVACGGVRLGRHWVHLGGLRVPTFSCFIGGSQLTIDGTTHFYNENGQDAGPETAIYYSMSEPKWSWSAKER